MPFIDSKITVSLTPEKEEAIKTKLGEAIQILNKSETYLMVGFEDNYDLYMGGSKLDKGAYPAEGRQQTAALALSGAALLRD